MKQCAARQFENELVERLSILANRHLRPPAPERGPHSMSFARPSLTQVLLLDLYSTAVDLYRWLTLLYQIVLEY